MMPHEPTITAKLREWKWIDDRRGVRAKIYDDTRDLNFMDGDNVYIIVQAISEYDEYFLVKTQHCCFQCDKKDMIP